MSLYNEMKVQFNKHFGDKKLIIFETENDLEIVFHETLNLTTLKKVDRLLKKDFEAKIFARNMNLVVRIEKIYEAPTDFEVIDSEELETPLFTPTHIALEPKEEPLEKGVCDFCRGKGRIADLLPCYKCKETGIEIPEKSKKEDFWDWDEKVETYKKTKYYIAGIEVDLDTLS